MKPILTVILLLSVGCGNSNTAVLPTGDAARRAAEAPPAPIVKATLPIPAKSGK